MKQLHSRLAPLEPVAPGARVERQRTKMWAAWTVRRARLVDVPAVARLLGEGGAYPAPAPAGPSAEAITSATRLILAHVGLDLGEFWVAVDAEERVLASVVLLPTGDVGQRRFRLALRLELGLLMPEDPQHARLEGVPTDHWLLLPAAGAHTEPMLTEWMLAELLAVALPTVDASGLPVISLQAVPPSGALAGAGFASLPGSGPALLPGSSVLGGPGALTGALTGAPIGGVALRPAAQNTLGG